MTETSKKIAKFINIMEFPINMRAHWMPGNPAICIPSGGTVDGPYDVLVQYRFFRCIGLNKDVVETLVSDNGEYQEDVILKELEEEIVIKETDVITVISNDISAKVDEKCETVGISLSPKEKVKNYIESLGNNWIKATFDDLESLCQECGLFIENSESMKKVAIRWEYIKLLKEYIKS